MPDEWWISETGPLGSPKVLATLRSLAVSSFGIYLIHMIVIEILGGWLPLQISTSIGNALWSIPLVSMVVFGISFLAVHLLQKIPILKHVVP